MALLHKGLKYNIHAKKKDCIQTLALEAEIAITQLPTNERDVYRKMVAERIDKLQKQNPTHNTHPEAKLVHSIQRKLAERIDKLQKQNPTHNTHPEAKLVHSIQRKLKDHDTMITRADKGNTVVILPTH